MTDFNAWLDSTDEEKKKKALQTPSQQAASDIKKTASPSGKIDYNAFLSSAPKKPMIAPPSRTPTPTTQPQNNIGTFLSNLGDTIKNAIVKAVPQLQQGNKPTMPTPSVPSVNQIKTPTSLMKTLDNAVPPVSGQSATMTPEAIASPAMQNFSRNTKNIIDSVMKFNPIDTAITAGQNAIAKQAENYSTGKKDTLPPLVYSLAFYQDSSNKILNSKPTGVAAPVWQATQNILKGHINAVNSSLLGSSEIMNKTLNEKFAAPKDIAGQKFYSVGQILGSVNTFLAGGQLLKAVGVTKLSMPILLNAVSQLSAKPGTTFLQRLAKIPNDTIAGWLASMIPGSDKFFSTKTFVGAGQTGAVFYLNSFVNSLIEGLSPEKAAEVANQAGLVGALFHTGSVALGRTGAKLFGEQKAGEQIFTPEQAINQADGTNLNGTPGGDYLKGKAIEAQAQGKNLKIEVIAQKQGALVKGEGLIPKLGEKATTKIGGAIGADVVTTPDGIGFRATLVDAPAPIQQLNGQTTAKAPATETPTTAIVPGLTAEPQQTQTLSGRIIPPPPSIRTDTGRVATTDSKKADIWLVERGIAEAQSKSDEFNLQQFQNIDPAKITNAEKQNITQYLFGDKGIQYELKNKTRTDLQTIIQTKITDTGAVVKDISVDKQGYTTIQTNKVNLSYKENKDTIDIVGFKRMEEGVKGEPTVLLNQIKDYASSQDKTITATKITGGDIGYWKKVGFTPIDISGGKGTQFEAIWEKPSTPQGGVIKGKDVAQKFMDMGTDNGNGRIEYPKNDDWLTMEISKYDYVLKEKNIIDIINGQKDFEKDAFDKGDFLRRRTKNIDKLMQPIILEPNGGIADGAGRLNQLYKDGVKTIQVYEPIQNKQKESMPVPGDQSNKPLPNKGTTVPPIPKEEKLINTLIDRLAANDTAFIQKMKERVATNPNPKMKQIFADALATAQARLDEQKNSVAVSAARTSNVIAKPVKLNEKKLYTAIGNKKSSIPYKGSAVVSKGEMTVASDDFGMIVRTKTNLPDGQYTPLGDEMVKQKGLEDVVLLSPDVTDKKMGTISAASLQRIAKQLSSFVSEDDTRPALQGAMFEIANGSLSTTTTDGFRMFHSKEPTNLKDGTYILPKIADIHKISSLLDGQVTMSQNDERIQLSSPNGTTVSLGKVDLAFPPYQKVYPALARSFEVSRTDLADAIKELKPFAKLKANQIGFTPKGNELILKTTFVTASGETIEKIKSVPIISTPSVSTNAGDILRGSIIMPVYIKVQADKQLIDKGGFVLNYKFIEDTLKGMDSKSAFISTVLPEDAAIKPIHISDRNELEFEPAPLKRAPSGVASAGAESLGAFESRMPEAEREKHDLKIFEQVQALIEKYASTVGEGYTPRGALGVYYPKTQNIRVNGMNDLSVASHEITHFLDYAFKISDQLRGISGYSDNGHPIYDKATRQFRKEITDLYIKYYPGGRKTHSLHKRTVEGFATLLQKYVEMPTQITKEYPDLVAQFLTPGGEFYKPVMGDIIKDLEKFIEDYQALEPLDKIGARVTNGLLESKKGDFLNIFDKIRTFTEDQIYPIEKLSILAGVHFTGDDPSLWMRAYSNAGGVYANNILNGKTGYWNMNGDGEFKKVFDFNWKTLLTHLKKEKIDDSFGNYLVARDQYFEWQELDKLQKAYEQAKLAVEMTKPEELTNVDGNGKTVIDLMKEARVAYAEQKRYLNNNGFTRNEVEEAYTGNQSRFVAEADMYDKLVREDLTLLNNPLVGLVNDEQYRDLTQKQGYASMKRQMFDDILGNEGDKMVGAKTTRASSLKHRTGGQQQIINPVLNGMVNHIEITKKAMRQAIYNKIGKIAQSSKLPELFQVQQLRAFPDDQGRIIFPQERDPNIIMARINGKRVPFLVDKTIKKTVDEVLTYQAMNLFENLMVNVSRGFTLGTTGAYAPFALTNVVVDQWSAVMNTRNNYIPLLDITKIIGKALTDRNSPAAQYYQEWQILGGDRMTLFQSQMQTMEEAVKYVTEETGKLEKVQLLIDKGIDILSIPAKYSETMSRFTEYYKARKAGKNQLVALEEAGRVTAPFHHIGSWKIGDLPSAKYMVRSVPFGNAAFQALAQAIRTGQTKNGRGRILFLMAALVASYLSSLWAVSQLGSEDQKQQYKDLTPTDIATYLHFPAIGGNGLYRIKVSQELSTLGAVMIMALSDNIMGTKYNANDYKDALTNWVPRQINIFSPIEMFFSWLPPALKIPLELIANFKDYPRVKPLENMTMTNLPPGQRFNEATSPVAKLIGEKFNLSPIKTDFLIEGFMGRAARYITGKKGAYDMTSGGYREYFFSMGRRIQDFYDSSTETTQQWNYLKQQYKGKTNIPTSAKQKIAEVNKKRQMDNYLSGMIGDLRKIDIKKEKSKAIFYRNKIVQGFEQLDKMK